MTPATAPPLKRSVSCTIRGALPRHRNVLDLLGAGAPPPFAYAISALEGEEVALSRAEVTQLLAVPVDHFSNVATLGLSTEQVARWCNAGLLLADATDERSRLRRVQEDALCFGGWEAANALFHGASRWRDVQVKTDGNLDLTLEQARAAAQRYVAEHGAAPSPFYETGGEVIALPREHVETPLQRLLTRRRTTRLFERAPIALSCFAHLLWQTFGFQGRLDIADGHTVLRRTSPAGGGLHAIEAYPLVAAVDGLSPGLYHYRSQDHLLERVTELSESEARELIITFTAGQQFFGDAAAVVVLASRFARLHWKYRCHQKAMAIQFADAGHLSQTFYLLCAEVGIGAFVTVAVNSANIDDLLSLDGFSQGAVALLGCGLRSSRSGAYHPSFQSMNSDSNQG